VIFDFSQIIIYVFNVYTFLGQNYLSLKPQKVSEKGNWVDEWD